MLCAHEQTAEFLKACGLVDRWMSVQASACSALFGGSMPEDAVLNEWLGRCEVAVGWTGDDDGAMASALKQCGAAAVIVRSPFASTLASVHQSDRFLEIMGGQPDEVSMAPLSLPEQLRVEAEARLVEWGIARNRPLAIIHPGSGSRHKCVKPAILHEVLKGLREQGLEALILEGPADHGMVEQLRIQGGGSLRVLQGLSLRLLAGVLSQFDVFLGHDSGVSHLAALMGTPTVALFGPTDPARWAPRGPAVTVIRENACGCTSWEAVRNCSAKPCLDLSPQAILAACRSARTATVNPRIR
jgi:ADP-heptose:LPS heptosyltransferase